MVDVGVSSGRIDKMTPSEWHLEHGEQVLWKFRNARKKLREAVVNFLGGKCARCGFNDIRALQIDHIHGGGTKELRKYSPSVMYHSILSGKFPKEKYQILCANCNWIKRHENQEYYKDSYALRA